MRDVRFLIKPKALETESLIKIPKYIDDSNIINSMKTKEQITEQELDKLNITHAYMFYKEACAKDERAVHNSSDAINEMRNAMAHVNYLLEEYYKKYVKVEQLESD